MNPPRGTLENASIVVRIKDAFRLWCVDVVPHMQKTARVTTGARVEKHFLDILELIYRAYYSQTEKKNDLLTLSIQKTDLLKFLLQITWENKLIQNHHYIELSEKINEVGKMLGGWKKGIESKMTPMKTPHNS